VGRRKIDMFPTKFVFRSERGTRTIELFGTLVERMEKLYADKVLGHGSIAPPPRVGAGAQHGSSLTEVQVTVAK
jgi:hypothetical protein